MVISIIVGPKFIEFLRRNEFGQHIREEGPEHHVDKQGTPVMGGLLILVTASIAFLAVSTLTGASCRPATPVRCLLTPLEDPCWRFRTEGIPHTNRRTIPKRCQ